MVLEIFTTKYKNDIMIHMENLYVKETDNEVMMVLSGWRVLIGADQGGNKHVQIICIIIPEDKLQDDVWVLAEIERVEPDNVEFNTTAWNTWKEVIRDTATIVWG